mgnify:CR=1 FL=1
MITSTANQQVKLLVQLNKKRKLRDERGVFVVEGPKMFREAKEYGLREPELIDMGSDFRINLYRKDAATDQNGVIDPKERDTDDTNDTKVEPNDTNEEAILRILQSNPKATQKDVVEMLGVSLATVKRLMNSLQKAGKIIRKGSNRSGSWVVIDQKE